MEVSEREMVREMEVSEIEMVREMEVRERELRGSICESIGDECKIT